MKLLSRLPLRALLTLPYVALVLGTAIVIGILSYASGRDAVDNLSGQLLTGLANREALIRRVEDRIVQQRRRGDPRPFAVLFVDINNFKKVNDAYGHDVGDAVLQEIAARLAGAVRADDLVARYAGDEFLVMLDAADRREDVERICAHLVDLMAQPLAALPPDGPRPQLGAAIGHAVYPEDGQDVDTLVRHADQQMYLRKRES